MGQRRVMCVQLGTTLTCSVVSRPKLAFRNDPLFQVFPTPTNFDVHNQSENLLCVICHSLLLAIMLLLL